MATLNQKNLATLQKNRERYFQRVQLAFDLIKTNQKKDFLMRCKQMDETFKSFDKCNSDIETVNADLTADETAVDTLKVTKAFEELFFRVKVHEAELNETAAAQAAAAQVPLDMTTQPNERAQKVKLPTITVPMFDGNIMDFPAWKSLYDELVHTANLSDIHKFSYLRSYLKGSALTTIDTITFTAANYPLAYKTVVDRYSKKRTLASHYLNKLLDFPPIGKDTSVSLRNFLDNFHSVVESLRSLTLNNLEEFMLLHLGLRVLDSKTTMEFEKEMQGTQYPTFKNLATFVTDKVNILELSIESNHSIAPAKPRNVSPKVLVTNIQTNKLQSDVKERNTGCSVCHKGYHKIGMCSKFKALDPHQRFCIIKNLQLCYGCFSSSHACSECPSQYSCRFCGSPSHHTLLHPDSGRKPVLSENYHPDNNKPSTSTSKPTSLQSLECKTMNENSSDSVLLGTATIRVQDFMGSWINIRCVIDPGSQITAITEKLAQLIKLPRKPCSLEVAGIGSENIVRSKGEMQCYISPHLQMAHSACEPFLVKAIILPKITSELSSNVPASVMSKFAHLQLADLSYNNNRMSSCIDMLLGAEYYTNLIISAHPIIQGSPAAVPSKLGWLLIGRVNSDIKESNQINKSTSLFIYNHEDPISTQLQRFWEIEDVDGSTIIENPEDLECEEHFQKTHSRDETGRYIVRLPFKRNQPPQLGTNELVALQRMKTLTRKLEKNPAMKSLYEENLQSYIDAGHMVVANKSSSYILVHHGVYKETSSTTKLRVVFDPNVKGSNNLSLADSLMVGPKLQSDIGDLLINFRLNAVALTADIQAMYRSIRLAEDDCTFQHIFWYDQEFQKLIQYKLMTVTFGIPPSPYQAQRVLKQLVMDEGQRFPLAAPVLESDIYVDDIVTGGSTVSEVIKMRNQLISLMGAGGFKLRKWASSHPEVIGDLPLEECEVSHNLGSDEAIKILGLKWCPADDVFFFSVFPPPIEAPDTLTKRKVLSAVAKIYDCNGYLSPVTVWMKIFLQQLWLDSSASWDTPFSEELKIKWEAFTSEMPILRDLKIPRRIVLEGVKKIDLIGFADASKAAYAAVVYLRTCDATGKVNTYLLRAKTKVAPLKVLTINRLELCAALLLSKAIKSLTFLSSKLTIENVYLFSDSSVVLSWIRTPPHRLKIYVGNRVSQILEITKLCQWRHVTTDKNPADPASRGLKPSLLIHNGLWLKGPSFLRSPIETWPEPCIEKVDCLPELRPVAHTLIANIEEPYLISVIRRFSSLSKLKRVFAYVLRFINNLKNPTKRQSKQLSLQELNQSLLSCVKITQAFYFEAELKAVKCDKMCSANIRYLSPIINSTGFLAVGGRLAHAPLIESAKHPILLPKSSYLATLIVWDYHQQTLHGGPKLVQSLIQQKWWIIGARGLIRQLLFKCVPCFKMKPKVRQPVMADLPVSRYSQGRPFINVGVDFAGPFSFKTGPRRNSPIDKCYFALFVCMSTKCIHLELVSSLSSAAFLACLDRFVGRRGLPTCIFSDNGTNFQGAASYLKEVQLFLRNHQEAIVYHLHTKEVQWKNIPPLSPNMGGIWEAGVKSVKQHLRHVLQGQNWNFEELSTFLVQVEAILNSRPLCAISSNPNDGVDYLSPGHFLIGAPLLSRPEYDFTEQAMPYHQRWKLITYTTQSFWKRWSKDYLNTLIQRTKWIKSCEEVKVNDVVILHGQNLPLQRWPLGVVQRVLPGVDGVTRVLEVRTSKGTILRPVSKVSVLPLEESNGTI